MFKCLIVGLCLMLPLTVAAALYKVVGEDGKVVYTDMQPNPDAKEHRLGRINSVSNPAYNMDKVNMRLHYVDDAGAMIVQGTVNGISMSFVVDTGATLVVVPLKIAQQAGLMDGKTEMVTSQTANGTVRTPKVVIQQLNVDKVSMTDVAATIQTISPNQPELGLLGMSFFGKYKMTIDHDKQEILLEGK
ncbi:MAG: TIGR02281 family clan AA aspartic protease [Mariprofundaceae bacterium]|nr:TIGR02281 family clan AA aspartic protease [Mariprofundaceae bacterium]